MMNTIVLFLISYEIKYEILFLVALITYRNTTY